MKIQEVIEGLTHGKKYRHKDRKNEYIYLDDTRWLVNEDPLVMIRQYMKKIERTQNELLFSRYILDENDFVEVSDDEIKQLEKNGELNNG